MANGLSRCFCQSELARKKGQNWPHSGNMDVLFDVFPLMFSIVFVPEDPSERGMLKHRNTWFLSALEFALCIGLFP